MTAQDFFDQELILFDARSSALTGAALAGAVPARQHTVLVPVPNSPRASNVDDKRLSTTLSYPSGIFAVFRRHERQAARRWCMKTATTSTIEDITRRTRLTVAGS
jgi:hypothetical protein